MLVNSILENITLKGYICNECSENGISLLISDRVEEGNLVIIKVDEYYNSLTTQVPPSPDCLVVQRCTDGNFIIYIVELKDINGPRGFTIENVTNKFITCLDDFMSQRFVEIFHNNNVNIKKIMLYFITDPYGFIDTPEKQNKMKGLKIDALMAQRIPKYFGLYLYIEHRLPNPTIIPCF